METGSNTVNRRKLWSTRDSSWFPVRAFYENVAVLNDGTLVAVLEVVPLDMALMAREESQTVLARFWRGIKGLELPLAVYLGRRRQDVAAYLKQVEDLLAELARKGTQQEDFYGRLLEEHQILVQGLLRDHLRSRYALLAVSHSPFHGLGQSAGQLFGKKKLKPEAEQVQRGVADLHMAVRRIEDLLRQVGLKHARYTGIQLAAEVARLCRPGLAQADVTSIERGMVSPPVIGGSWSKGFMPELVPWKHEEGEPAPAKGGASMDAMEEAALPLRDRIAPLRFQQTLSTYSLGDGHVARVWRVYDYVSPISRERIEEFYALPFDLRLALRWEKINDFTARQSLEHQSAMLRGQEHFNASKGRMGSYASAATLESIDAARRDLDGPRRESLFYFSLLVQLTCRSREELDQQSKELELAMKNAGFTFATCDALMEEAFRSMLPLGRPEVRTDRLMNASGVALFFPFYHAEYVDPDGFYFGAHRQSGTLVAQNIFKGNGNTILVGKPGSGKSALFKTIAIQAAACGMGVYLLDLEGEYRPVVEALRGSYLDMGLSGGATINVLRLNPDDPEGYAGQFGDIQSFLEVMMGRPMEAAQVSALTTGLAETYRRFGIDVDDPSTWSKEPQPILVNLMQSLETSATLREKELSPVGRQLALALEPYTIGPYREAFNGDTNVDLGNRVIGFGFTDIRESHLRTIRVFQALRLLGARALGGKRLSLIGVDEAWWYFGQSQAVEALSAFSRRCRKRGASIWFLTHQPEDFLRNADTKQILSSAQTVILMNQARSVVESLKGVCDLSDREIEDVVGLMPGSFVLIVRDVERHVTNHIPVQLVVVPRWWQMLDTSYQRVAQQAGAGGK